MSHDVKTDTERALLSDLMERDEMLRQRDAEVQRLKTELASKEKSWVELFNAEEQAREKLASVEEKLDVTEDERDEAVRVRDAFKRALGRVEQALGIESTLDLTESARTAEALKVEVELLRGTLEEIARRSAVGPPDPPGPKMNFWYNTLVELSMFARSALATNTAKPLLDAVRLAHEAMQKSVRHAVDEKSEDTAPPRNRLQNIVSLLERAIISLKPWVKHDV